MSTDLEFRSDGLELRLSPIKVNSNNSSCSDDEECKTPTSPGSRIPAILSCPPAPRKRRTMLRTESCKRKLEFFDLIAFEEIEEFFDFVESQRRSVKRSRCGM
ncbi:cyclin-dependent protein kinase inhibitor SMR2-like [Heracleum sosnowskyi]|uniref:Cyclin-dependent protein kinase inhibitor SMR2-like n=1 Tax=Heracleum sosnowskyi TaxID=360622 RepID=A0AAD8J5X4_9APIA|nr:cyclin-dependent protein kinase inhibitor SMR2-like [Heracleum sosnowskyi]